MYPNQNYHKAGRQIVRKVGDQPEREAEREARRKAVRQPEREAES